MFKGSAPLQSITPVAGTDSVSESHLPVQSLGNVLICIPCSLLFKGTNLPLKLRNTMPGCGYGRKAVHVCKLVYSSIFDDDYHCSFNTELTSILSVPPHDERTGK